ncbi:MAG: sulfatase [Bacteroidales bacterium]|nr:sulfatase [Bacteroidales bacterium]
MIQYKSIGLLALAGFTSVVSAKSKVQPTPAVPNVVLILMDDMGYGDVGCFGATGYNTPNIDQLASEGMRFTNFYVAQAVSSASRASLLTGCYANRIGFANALPPKSEIGINPSEVTIAEMLKEKGYATAAIGKWHLGDYQLFLPLQNGFDEYFGIPYSHDMWPVNYDGTPADKASNKRGAIYPPLPLMEGNSTVRILNTPSDQNEITTLYTEKAVKFIQKNRHHPFFLYLAHSQPHVPLAVSDKFRGKSGQGLYADVMMEVDWGIGEVMKALRQNGVEKNTLVIFTSDNGPWLCYGNHSGSAGGLREGKGTSFEGGQRVPCLMKWPGHIPQGIVCNKLASTIDVLPTLSFITGAKLPTAKIDGVNIIDLMKNRPKANPRDYLLYYYNQNSLEAIRKGSWKLVLPHPSRSYVGVAPGRDGFPGEYAHINTGLELYDLRRDPGEQYNVILQYPEIVKELQPIIDEARFDLGDDLTNNSGHNRRKPGRFVKQQ